MRRILPAASRAHFDLISPWASLGLRLSNAPARLRQHVKNTTVSYAWSVAGEDDRHEFATHGAQPADLTVDALDQMPG